MNLKKKYKLKIISQNGGDTPYEIYEEHKNALDHKAKNNFINNKNDNKNNLLSFNQEQYKYEYKKIMNELFVPNVLINVGHRCDSDNYELIIDYVDSSEN